jgi:hypothetical protein
MMMEETGMGMEAGMAMEEGSGNRSLSSAPGFELDPRLVSESSADTHMLGDVERILRLTPEERLQEVANLSRFFTEAKRVRRRA